MKIIVNPKAGHGRGLRQIDQLQRKLKENALDYQLIATARAGHATEIARELASSGEERIVVMGGDGTIAEVVNGVVGSDIELGLIPVGTGNDLARSLGVPFNDLDGALRVLETGRVKRIDVGRERDRHFILMVAVGFPALVAEQTNRMKRLRGPAAFFVAVYRALHRMQTVPVKLALDEKVMELECSSILVQNTPYCGGGQLMAPGASLQDGELDIIVVRPIGKLSLMVNFPKVYQGRHIEHPAFSQFRAKRVSIETPVRLKKMFDGDLFGETPVEAEACHKVLRVVVPAD